MPANERMCNVTLATIEALRDVETCPRPIGIHGDVYVRHSLAIGLKMRDWVTIDRNELGRDMVTITKEGRAMLKAWREAVAVKTTTVPT